MHDAVSLLDQLLRGERKVLPGQSECIAGSHGSANGEARDRGDDADHDVLAETGAHPRAPVEQVVAGQQSGTYRVRAAETMGAELVAVVLRALEQRPYRFRRLQRPQTDDTVRTEAHRECG